MTVNQALAVLRQAGCDPQAVGEKLKLTAAPPPAVAKYLCVLQTGIRSVLTRKAWYYMTQPNTPRPNGGTLDPAKKIPFFTNLLTVAGDAAWDRVDSNWRLECPELFKDSPKG